MRFQTTLSRKHLLGVLLAFSVIASLTGQRVGRPLGHVMDVLLPPISDAPMWAVTELGRRISTTSGEGISAEDAAELRRRSEYHGRLAAFWRSQAEGYYRRSEDLSNFQRMYGPTRDIPCELIPGRVVAAGSLPYDGTRLVGVGVGQTVSAGAAVTTRQVLTQRSKALPPRLAVVNANSLVGRILTSAAFTARLQLLTDRGFQMHGRIRRVISPDRPRTITLTEGSLPRTTPLTPESNYPIDVLAVGDGVGRLIVKQVKAYHNVRKGDLLTTAREKEDLPMEIHVGKVVEVRPDDQDARRVTLWIEPHADLENIRDVYIISLPAEPASAGP